MVGEKLDGKIGKQKEQSNDEVNGYHYKVRIIANFTEQGITVRIHDLCFKAFKVNVIILK